MFTLVNATMKATVYVRLTFLIFCFWLTNSSAQEESLVEVFTLIKSALGVKEFVSDLWNLLLAQPTDPKLPVATDRESLSQLLTQFNQLSSKLTHVDDNIAAVRQTLRHLQTDVSSAVSWELTIETLENLLRPINSNYDRFLHYQRHRDEVETSTLMDFAQHAVSHSAHSLHSTMSDLHHLVKGLGMSVSPGQRTKRYAFKQGLFRQLQLVLTTSDTKVCHLNQSPQQLAYSLYAIVSLTLAKSFSMIQFSYMLLRSFNKGNFTVESDLAEQYYNLVSYDVAQEAKDVIRPLSSVFWRCDPRQHTLGLTYDQVTQLLQGYMANEVDLNPQGTCNNNCAYYQHTRRQGCYMKRDFMLCGVQRPCRGQLHDCRFYDSDSRVCLAGGQDPGRRRYDWIEFEDGQTLGRVGTCRSHKVDSWWRNLFWHCSYCMCLCDDPTDSDRYFSLATQLANVTDNMVVTGVRWVKLERVFYLQIEQGRADKFGFVNASSVHWKPITPIHIDQAEADADYMALSWQRRAIDLDDLIAPDGHVITGVALRRLGEHINLKIQVTPIAARTAQLNPQLSYWMSSDATPSSTEEQSARVLLTGHVNADLSTRSLRASVPDSGRPRGPDGAPLPAFLQFEASSMALDVAQTTLPFVELQPVAPRPSVWLAGIGLYHKGSGGYGGFLALRVHTVDLLSRVTTPVAPSDGKNESDVASGQVFKYETRSEQQLNEQRPIIV